MSGIGGAGLVALEEIADNTTPPIPVSGAGAGGTESTKIQIPYVLRSDTAVGFYHTSTENIFLPEPREVAQGTRVAVRVTDSIASAITYGGTKIWYRQGATAVSSTVKDMIQAGVLAFAR